jgi:hypothetical protein
VALRVRTTAQAGALPGVFVTDGGTAEAWGIGLVFGRPCTVLVFSKRFRASAKLGRSGLTKPAHRFAAGVPRRTQGPSVGAAAGLRSGA